MKTVHQMAGRFAGFTPPVHGALHKRIAVSERQFQWISYIMPCANFQLISLLAAVVLLAGCQTVDRNIETKRALADIPLSLLQKCPALSKIPNRDLMAREIARMWQSDRNALRVCANRHAGLARAIRERDRIQSR